MKLYHKVTGNIEPQRNVNYYTSDRCQPVLFFSQSSPIVLVMEARKNMYSKTGFWMKWLWICLLMLFKIIFFGEEKSFRLHCYYYQVSLLDFFSFLSQKVKVASGWYIEHCFETYQVSTHSSNVLLMPGSLKGTIKSKLM